MPFNKRNAIRHSIERHDFPSTLKRVLAFADHKPLSPIRLVERSVNDKSLYETSISYSCREREREMRNRERTFRHTEIDR